MTAESMVGLVLWHDGRCKHGDAGENMHHNTENRLFVGSGLGLAETNGAKPATAGLAQLWKLSYASRSQESKIYGQGFASGVLRNARSRRISHWEVTGVTRELRIMSVPQSR